MKISCPGCGKTYQVPQELIDAILREHRSEPIELKDEMFIPADPMPAMRRPESITNPSRVIGFVMLGVTLLWPMAILACSILFYKTTVASAIEKVNLGPMGYQYVLPGRNGLFSPGDIASESIIQSLVIATILYGMCMTILAVAWFAMRGVGRTNRG